MSMPAPTIDYQPYDDDSQLARYIDRYPLSFKRTPLAPLISQRCCLGVQCIRLILKLRSALLERLAFAEKLLALPL